MRYSPSLVVIVFLSAALAAPPVLCAQSPRVSDARLSFPVVSATFGATTPVAGTTPYQIGRPTYAGEGALIGALAAGGALLILTQGMCNADSACQSGDMALPIIGGVAGGAILGLLIGGAISKSP